MKNTILLVLLLACSGLYAQETQKINKFLTLVVEGDAMGIKKGNEWILRPTSFYWDERPEGVYIYTPSDQVGFISATGDVVFDTIYNAIHFIAVNEDKKEGFMLQDADGKIGYYSVFGKELIPFDYQEFEFYSKYILSMQGDYHTLYDYDGKVVIPRQAQHISVFGEGKSTRVEIMRFEDQIRFLDQSTSLPEFLTYVSYDFAMAKEEVSIYEYCLFLTSFKMNPEFQDQFYDESSYITWEKLLPQTHLLDDQLKDFWTQFLTRLEATQEWKFIVEKHSSLHPNYQFHLPYKLSEQEVKLASLPVTAISHEAARCFANWLTYAYSSSLGEPWSFSLPTKEQWEVAVLRVLPDDKKGVPDSLDASGCSKFNYNGSTPCNMKDGLSWYQKGKTLPVRSSGTNKGVFTHLFGNAAEMLLEEGKAVGGSYVHPASEAKLGAITPYEAPQEWLGFRLLAIPKSN